MEVSIYDVEKYLDAKVGEVAKKAQLTMQGYLVSRGHVRTGALVRSIVCRKEAPFTWFVGSYHGHAFRIYYGRREVRPVRKKYLHYYTKSGQEIFSKYSAPVPPDDFVSATIARM